MAQTTEVIGGPAAAGAAVPLKLQLKRAERRTKLKYVALIVPLAVFLAFTFVWPIIELLYRAVDNPEIATAMPRTTAQLRQWDRKQLPDEAAFAALAEDLTAAKGTPELAAAGKRLNMEVTGYRSLVINTARKLPLEAGQPAKEALIEIDPRWGELATWQLIARNGSTVTPFYLLAAVDFTMTPDGRLAKASPDQSIYLAILARTFWMSVIVTAWCLALAYPLAYLMANQPPRIANLLMILVLLPFWTSVLVRVAAWIVLLQNEGPINRTLQALGLTSEPVQLVFNRTGVYIAMVHILLPFAVLPLYAVMKGVSPTLVRAALSLGCPPFRSFWKIYFPQTLPGIGAGGLLVFILAMGYYITPALLGSPKEQMASYFVAFYTNETVNWGMAAALATILLVATLLLYVVYARYFGPTRVRQVKPR
ncbi:MAG TPA: ABC transporter permease [Casimicrobiaceae bacterium]|nr:ABC transporter permease [Casimicrobiaceae bacterium]